MTSIAPADEGRHPSGPEDLWGESWYFDFAAADGSYGGYVRLGLYPNRGVAWFWLALVEPGRPLVFIRDHGVAVPAGESLTIDAGVYRAEIRADAAFARWSVVVRGAACAREDPAGAFTNTPTTPADVDVRLEWAGAAAPFAYAVTTRYEQTSHVTGSVTVDGRTTAVDAPGQRDHSWGVRDWWDMSWCWAAGTFADDRAFHLLDIALSETATYATGYTVAAIGPDAPWAEVTAGSAATPADADGQPAVAALMYDTEGAPHVVLEATPLAHAPLLLVADDGRESRFVRTMMRYTDLDGAVGTGWLERNWPPGSTPE